MSGPEGFKYEIPDMGEGVNKFGSRDYSDGELVNRDDAVETVKSAKAKKIEKRIGAFLARKSIA